jgi:hypothetical protein
MLHFTKLPGVWTKQGNEFRSNHNDGFSLLLVERKNPNQKQPKKYILAIFPSGQREYVSGVLENNSIDYQGRVFNFQMDQTNQFTII